MTLGYVYLVPLGTGCRIAWRTEPPPTGAFHVFAREPARLAAAAAERMSALESPEGCYGVEYDDAVAVLQELSAGFEPSLADQAARILGEFRFPPAYALPTYDARLRAALYDAFGGADYYTGSRISLEEMVVDHVVPKILGGPDNLFNYVPTTARINGAKGAKFSPEAARAVLAVIATHYGRKAANRLDHTPRTPAMPRKERTAPKQRAATSPRPEEVRINGEVVSDRAAFVLELDRPSHSTASLLCALRHGLLACPAARRCGSDVSILGGDAALPAEMGRLAAELLEAVGIEALTASLLTLGPSGARRTTVRLIESYRRSRINHEVAEARITADAEFLDFLVGCEERSFSGFLATGKAAWFADSFTAPPPGSPPPPSSPPPPRR